MANILDTLGSLLGGSKTENNTTTTAGAGNATGGFDINELINMGSSLLGSDVGKQLTSHLDGLKSLSTSQIGAVLGTLDKSDNSQVQAAAKDLATSKDDGETFVSKLQGYVKSISAMLPALLPALEKMFVK